MEHDRAYKRRMTRLKNRRKKDMCKYLSYGTSIWFDENKQRVCYAHRSDSKKVHKSLAAHRYRRNLMDQPKGSAYKKIYDVKWLTT